LRRRRRRRDQPRVEIRERGLPDETKNQKSLDRPIITGGFRRPRHHQQTTIPFIISSFMTIVVLQYHRIVCFFAPTQTNHRIHFWAEGRRVKGTAAALCPRRDTPPGRRVGFFARVLSFLLCKKNASQVFPSYRATSSVIPQRFGGFHIWGRRGQDQPRPPLHLPSTAPRRIKCVTDERERVFNI